MNLVVVTEQRFTATPAGIYGDGPAGYPFWARYLAVFDSVRVVGRVHAAAQPTVGAVRADGVGVTFEPLSYYVGPAEGLSKLPDYLQRTRRAAAARAGAYILRAPGVAASVVYYWLRLYNWPYAVEVVGDPAESLSYSALRTRWSHVVRQPLITATAQLVANAVCSSYVTAHTLQARYPNTRGHYTTHVSDTALPPDVAQAVQAALAGAQPAPTMCDPARPLRLVFVGSLAQRYKGLHVLLEALAACRAAGVALTLHVLGGGAQLPPYQAQAQQLDLTTCVTFAGNVEHAEVFAALQAADIFVMPSLVEGLPRAMIEAMACGLPVVGSRVGGIPELLSDEMMVPAGDAPALAARLLVLAADPALRAAVGRRNQLAAATYLPDRLRERHEAFLHVVRQLTAQHMGLEALPG